MIDARGLLGNGFWVLGLAFVLTALSLSYWQARLQAQPFRRVLERRAFFLPLAVGMFFFAVGLLLLEHRLWAQVLWGVLALAWLWQGWLAAHRPTTDSRPPLCSEPSAKNQEPPHLP